MKKLDLNKCFLNFLYLIKKYFFKNRLIIFEEKFMFYKKKTLIFKYPNMEIWVLFNQK